MKKKRWIVGVMPCFIIITIFLVLPIVTMIIPSFWDGQFTFENYKTFLSDPFYQAIIWRSLKLSLITTLICVVAGVPTAYFISRQSQSVKSMALAFVMFPLLTNAVVRGFAWMMLLGRNGVINGALSSLRIIEEPLSLMYTESAIVIGSVYLFLPLMITTLVSVMDGIDNEVIEASQSLGARGTSIFFKVILPLSFSGILVGSVLVFTGTLSAYTTPSLLGGNRNMMLATLLYQQANQLSNWTHAGMISLLMILLSTGLMGIMSWMNRKLDRRGYEHA